MVNLCVKQVGVPFPHYDNCEPSSLFASTLPDHAAFRIDSIHERQKRRDPGLRVRIITRRSREQLIDAIGPRHIFETQPGSARLVLTSHVTKSIRFDILLRIKEFRP